MKRLPLRRDGVTVFVLTFALVYAGAWIPSLWFDEAATIVSTDRSTAELFRMLGNVDAVHGFYYLVMQLWETVFGLREWSVRLPSSIAVGCAAVAMYAVGVRLRSRAFGFTCAAALMVLPRTTWAGVEARSYALVLAVSAVLMLLAIRLADDPRRRRWVAFCITATLLTVLFIYSALLVIVLTASIYALWRSKLRKLLLCAFIPVGVASPVIVLAVMQAQQVSWIRGIGRQTWGDVFVEQWFDTSAFTAIAVGVIIVLAFAAKYFGGSEFPYLLWAIPPLIVPTAVIIIYSTFGSSVYVPRYLTFTTPALALLIASSIVAIGAKSWWIVAFLALFSAPTYVAQRMPYAKPGGSDFSAVANYLKSVAKPGDCIAYATPTWSPYNLRMIGEARPDAVAGLQDIGPLEDRRSRNQLWDLTDPPEWYEVFADQCQRFWVVTDADRPTEYRVRTDGDLYWLYGRFYFEQSELAGYLRIAGFHTVNQHRLNISQVVLMER